MVLRRRLAPGTGRCRHVRSVRPSPLQSAAYIFTRACLSTLCPPGKVAINIARWGTRILSLKGIVNFVAAADGGEVAAAAGAESYRHP